MHRYPVLMALGLLIAAILPLTTPAQEKDPLAPQLKALESKKKDVRLAAVRQLGAGGTAAKKAVPALGKLMREDPDAAVANQAALALAQIGWPAVDELVQAVRQGLPDARYRALVALGRMGPQARKAVEALREVVRNKANATERGLAAYALADMGSAADSAVPDLCQALGEVNNRRRDQAKRQQKMQEVMRQRFPQMANRQASTKANKKQDPPPEALALRNLGSVAIPGLIEVLNHNQADVRLTGLETLAMLGAEALGAAPDIAKLLTDVDPELRIKAAEALAAIGPLAKDTIPALLANMKDKKVEVQQATFRALMRIGAEDVPGLMGTFRKINREGGWAQPLPLKQFGPALRDAVKPLIKDLQAPDEGRRLSAALALGEIGMEAREAVPSLQNALRDSSLMVRQSAAMSIMLIRGDQIKDKRENASKPLEQQLASARKIVASKIGPSALYDAQTQSAYNLIIDFHLMNSVRRANGDGIDVLADIQDFGPEAIPALVRGVNLAAYYRLGHC
jgi:HEAT repeat protein